LRALDEAQGASVPPLPSVIVPRSVVVLVDVVAVVVVGVVVVVEVEVEVVLVVGVVVLVVVELVVAVVVGVVVLELAVVVLSSLVPTTASATPRPTTTATRIAINALTPPLIPCRGGSPPP
jgi:hypothetical protein